MSILPPSIMSTKICRKCEISKPYAEFPKGRDSNGLYYICKCCATTRSQIRYRTMDKLQRWVDHTASDIKGRAKRKNIAYDLSNTLLREMYNEQHGKCAYCSNDFVLTNTKYARLGSPSVDRIVPTEGYTPKNVILCCHRCNAMKNDATPQELQTLANAVMNLFEQRGLTTVSQSDLSQIA